MLNDEQKQAVDYTDGPLLIIAGAGTGKTTVIVEKIKKLIIDKKIKPENILALTFTEKAAQEMEERVDQIVPYGYFQMWISTFHAFADEILRNEANHIGLNSNYKLLTQAESVLFLRKNLFLFNLKYFRPLGNPNKFITALLQHFSRLKDENVSPKEYFRWAQSPHFAKATRGEQNEEQKIEQDKYTELAHAYSKYEELKTKEGYFDFSDLIYYLLQLFQKRPNLLEKYRKQFQYFLVDEFQDTNIAQYLLIKLLCPPNKNPNLTLVGDDSQAIYKFRGASVSNILGFMKDYPQAKQITLNKNYRSTQEILDVAYKLIKFNDPDTLEAQLGISKELISNKPKQKNCVHFSLSQNIEEETEIVARKIIELRKKNSYKFSDFALLVRANSHADAFLGTLTYYGIPYRFLGPGMLFKQPEVKDLIAYLKVLYNLEDSVSLYRILSMVFFEIDSRNISLLLSFAKKTSLSLFQACEVVINPNNFPNYLKYIPFIQETTKNKIKSIIELINRHLSLIKKEPAGQILYYFLTNTGYLKKLLIYKTEHDEKIALNIAKFLNKLKKFESEHEENDIFAAVGYIEMNMELGESPLSSEIDIPDYDAVNILTTHSAKGLEFPVVFLVNLSQGRFPTYEKKESLPIPEELVKEILPQGDYHLEEERRLFYVGLTRAKDQLFLSSSLFYGEGKRQRKISSFVAETLGEEVIKKHELTKSEEKNQLSIFDYKKIPEPLLKEQVFIKNFSYSQLENFKNCPLQYKYQYILKIPGAASAPASFGDSIHKTLQAFYLEYLQDKTIEQKRMLEIFNTVWVPLGYNSADHEKHRKKQGEEMLIKFYKAHHPPKTPILGLEKFFRIRIENETYITGKIDRVDGINNNSVEIIDYKTGRKPDEKDLKKSLQLSIYAWAATDIGLYNKKLQDVTLTFYYLEDMSKISMQRTQEEIDLVKIEVMETITRIREGVFKPHVSPLCSFCPYKIICEAW